MVPDMRPEDAASPSYRRKVLILVALPAFLVPITTTIYLPSLNLIEEDLDTSKQMVGLTISSYVLLFGLMPLVYGPYSDRIGRKPILQVSLTLYIITSLLCSQVWSIEALITFRALQAMGVAGAMVVGAGAIADVFPREERGQAMGLFGVAPLIGPLVGPPLGGAIAAVFEWRFIFYFLSGAAALILLAVTLLLPETLDHKKAPRDRANPLEPLSHLRHPFIAQWALLGALMFGTMYAVLTLYPSYLETEHGLDEAKIGLAMIPFGIGSLAGTVLGGRAADRLGRKRASLSGTYLAVPVILLYAWTLDQFLGLTLTITVLFGFVMSYSRPGLNTYCIELDPRKASGITASLMTTSMLGASLASFLGPAGSDWVGDRWVFTVGAMLIFTAGLMVNRFVLDDKHSEAEYQ